MSRSLFRPEARAAIIARLEVGLTFKEAAAAAGIKVPTAQGWLARGKRETKGDYAEFADAVERAKSGPGIEAMTPEEHRLKVSEIARRGSVQALKLYWEIIRADREGDDDEDQKPKDSLDEIDELARRRAQAAGQ
jgi:hypothetical protein